MGGGVATEVTLPSDKLSPGVTYESFNIWKAILLSNLLDFFHCDLCFLDLGHLYREHWEVVLVYPLYFNILYLKVKSTISSIYH